MELRHIIRHEVDRFIAGEIPNALLALDRVRLERPDAVLDDPVERSGAVFVSRDPRVLRVLRNELIRVAFIDALDKLATTDDRAVNQLDFVNVVFTRLKPARRNTGMDQQRTAIARSPDPVFNALILRVTFWEHEHVRVRLADC